MGAKNPNYEKNPDVPGGGGDDDGPTKKSSHKVLWVCLGLGALILATFGLLFFFIKRKQKSESVSFQNYQEYGAVKQGKQMRNSIQGLSESDNSNTHGTNGF